MDDYVSKLEPFVLIGKGAKGAAAVKLIKDATSAPGVYVFAELLDLTGIQELASNPQHATSHALLHLFSYKTYQDYKLNKEAYPPLTPVQLTKLKHLSIATLSMETKVLPYPTLLTALDISTIRELEDLIIDAIYQNVVRGKLDQKEQQFEVEYTMGRDLQPGQLGSLLSALQDWSNRTANILTTLDDQIMAISSHEAAAKLYLEEQDKRRDTIVNDIYATSKSASSNGGGGLGGGRGDLHSNTLGGSKRGNNSTRDRDYDGMDLDEPSGGGGAFGGIMESFYSRGKKKSASQSGQTSSAAKRRGRS